MKSRTLNALRVLVVAIALAAGVGAVRAATPPPAKRPPEPVRIVPAAVPVELAPCAMGGCW